MKSGFENYKTPTMPECQSLGNDIGLAKRVVQVWFQNARAKEKKARLYLQQVTGVEPDLPAAPTGCRWCSLKYPENFAVQEHIFQTNHLDKVKIAIEQGQHAASSIGEFATKIGMEPPVRQRLENREEEEEGSICLEVVNSFCNPIFVPLLRVEQVQTFAAQSLSLSPGGP